MEVNWNVLLGDLITQLLRIFIPVLVALVLKWAAEIWLRIQEDKPELAEVLILAARIGYAAAEEYAKNNFCSGDDKMDVAIARAEDYLKELGLTVDLNVIRDAINDYGVSNWKFTWVKEGLEFDPDHVDAEEDHPPIPEGAE